MSNAQSSVSMAVQQSSLPCVHMEGLTGRYSNPLPFDVDLELLLSLIEAGEQISLYESFNPLIPCLGSQQQH